MYGVKSGGFDTLECLHAYYDGVADGLRCFAWHRDGTQYVGTTGTTLAEALEDVNTVRVAADQRMKDSLKEREATLANERKALRDARVRVRVTTEGVDDEHVQRFVEQCRAAGIKAEIVDQATFDAPPQEHGRADDGENTVIPQAAVIPQPGKRKRKKAGAAAGTNESGEDDDTDDDTDDDGDR